MNFKTVYLNNIQYSIPIVNDSCKHLSHIYYEIVKFFPASLMGGDKKLISIQNIVKELKFIPTGGIDNNNISTYLNLENVLCVGMSKFD